MTATQDFRPLPPRPHLDHLRSEAKKRHAVLKAVSRQARLSDAQLLVAREYGFADWPALKAEVDRRRGAMPDAPTALPLATVFRPHARTGPPGRLTALRSPAQVEQAFFPAAILVLATIQLGSLLLTLAA